MTNENHYQTLEVTQQATQLEIKQAYRRLVKQFHPDSHSETANHEKIISINAAYEVLNDPQSRHNYDQQVSSRQTYHSSNRQQQRTTYAQRHYQSRRQTGQTEDIQVDQWIKQIYTPINRLISLIINPLETEIEYLAADPFDEELMLAFQDYLQDCRNYLNQARLVFSSQPNPAKLANIAVSLYYCLNQISDGIDELEWFTLNYDDHYLHTGTELFRIARGLRQEAQERVK